MRIPQTTYRVQFHSGFTFEQAKNIVNYLSELGISDLYASPIFKASQGSTHGYDVTDPTQTNPELGTSDNFAELVAEIQKYGMGWLQDIVPNHMAYDPTNLWLMDVLKHGNHSRFFKFFDINWHHHDEKMKGWVLAPLLGNSYGKCLENGEIKLAYDSAGLSINYYQAKLPVSIESYSTFLKHNLDKFQTEGDRITSLLEKINSLDRITDIQEHEEQIKSFENALWELYSNNPDVAQFIESNLTEFNGEVGKYESFSLLDNLLSEQNYRLAYWKVAIEEINYRRFFTVNELISIKVEEEKVFQKTHEFIAQLVAENKITGVRIDHIDGLYDPKEYINRLRKKLGDVYITVEKILELKEDLPSVWQIQGTSGYEFLNYINGIFCYQDKEQIIDEIYTRFIGTQLDYESLVYDKKALLLETNLGGDLDNLTHILKKISGTTREGIDFTIYGLKRSLFVFLSLFPVYRTYIDSPEISEIDKHYIAEAIDKSKKHLPKLHDEIDFLHKLFLLDYPANLSAEQKRIWLNFVMRSQQLTGPLMAKGVEDTLLYIYNRLISLNEVGGNPSIFGIDLNLFHQFNQNKAKNWLHGMNATATHDTKRGEDVRARINVISEIPEEWEKQVTQWREINQSQKQNNIPDANDEYFLYQTIVGAFPFLDSELPDFTKRIKEYVLKAIREAKVNTDWLSPNEEYEKEFSSFIDRILDPKHLTFWQKFQPFQAKIAEYGIYNSLSQILVKNTAPGVPDLYQGAELWELSLVDPDNRRPVDYQKRMDFLQEIKAQKQTDILQLIRQLIESKKDGKIKLFLIHQLFKARQQHSEIFDKGDYQPIEAKGKYQNHVIAFARNYNGQTAIAIAPRFLTKIVESGQIPVGSQWEDTYISLPNGTWQNAIDGQTISGENLALADILSNFPAALLINSN